jgi:hypothetical protein
MCLKNDPSEVHLGLDILPVRWLERVLGPDPRPGRAQHLILGVRIGRP